MTTQRETIPRQTAALPDHTTGRLRGILWEALGKHAFRLSFHNWYKTRATLLRAFGANIDPTAKIRPTVSITRPWNLTVGRHTAVGDHAILFSLGPLAIGDRCVISQYSHLCAASFDYTKHHMPTTVDPITIGNDVWIAADVFVGPGVSIGDRTVVGARSGVFKSLPAGKICGGDNAKPLADRQFEPGPAPSRAVRQP